MVQYADEEFQPQDRTLAGALALPLLEYLNENTPAGEWSDETKQAVGLAMTQILSHELTDLVERLGALEPLMDGIFRGPLMRDKLLSQTTGREVARAAFAAMQEAHKLASRGKID